MPTYTNIAFISYKREDEAWAKWLQKQLEYYKLPTEIRKNPEYEFSECPRHVFRDTTDLSGGVLEEALKAGLDSSKFLIVICSPRAVGSEWVCKEVLEFIDSGRREKIIPFIVEGQPYAENAKDECFPEALRKLKKEQQPLGISIKENGREMAVVKVVATVFDLEVDSLWQRFKREEAQKRTNKMRILTFIASILILLPLLIASLYFSFNSKSHSPMSEYIGRRDIDTILMSSAMDFSGNLYADTLLIVCNSNQRLYIDRCNNIKSIIIISNSSQYSDLNSIHISNCLALNKIVIKGRVKEIGGYFVDNCPALKKIILPNEIQSIHVDAFTRCGIDTFVIPKSNPNIVWRDKCLWDIQDKRIIYTNFTQKQIFAYSSDKTYQDQRFKKVYGTSKYYLYVKFPNGISDSIDEVLYTQYNEDTIIVRNTSNPRYKSHYGTLYNYKNSNNNDITVSDNISLIMPGAFDNCKKIRKLTISGGIEIEENAFRNNQTLEHLEINANEDRVTLSKSAFENCKSLNFIEIKSAGHVKIENSAFFNCKKLKSCRIKCKSLTIDNYAFQRCHNLKEFIIENEKEIQLVPFLIDPNNNIQFTIKTNNLKSIKDGYKNSEEITFKNPYDVIYSPQSGEGNDVPLDKEKHSNRKISNKRKDTNRDSKYQIKKNPCKQLLSSLGERQEYKDIKFSRGNICFLYNNHSDSIIFLPPQKSEQYFLTSKPNYLKEIHLPTISPSPCVLLYIMKNCICTDCILYVPYGTSKTYREDGRYNVFKEIREDSFETRIWNIYAYCYYQGTYVLKFYTHALLFIIFITFTLYNMIAYSYYVYQLRKNRHAKNLKIKSAALSLLISTTIMLLWFIVYWAIYINIEANEIQRVIISNIVSIPLSYILPSFLFTGEANILKYGYFNLRDKHKGIYSQTS